MSTERNGNGGEHDGNQAVSANADRSGLPVSPDAPSDETRSRARSARRPGAKGGEVRGGDTDPVAPRVTPDTVVARAVGGGVTPPDDDECRLGFPTLWSFLTQDKYAKGQERTLGEIVITRVDGGYSVELRDHDTLQKLPTTCLTLLGFAEALEKAFTDPTHPWKPFKSYKNEKGLAKFKEKDA